MTKEEQLKQALESEEGKRAISEFIWEVLMRKRRPRDLTELTREALGPVCREDFGRSVSVSETCRHDAGGNCIHPAPWDRFDGRREYRRDEGWVCRSCWRVAVTEEQAETVNRMAAIPNGKDP